ncbi:MAG: copper resistance CopC family protein [Actinomycetota bacterium]
MTRILAALRGGAVALAVGFVTVVTGLGLAVVPAAAHVSLTSSTPEDGATLAEPPDEVVLEFDDELLAEFTQVAVLDQDDGNHEQGDPEIDGSRVTQAVGTLEPGEYRVSYRVGSGDGHPVSGVITFAVTEVPGDEQDAAETAAPEAATSADTPTESPAEQDESTPAAESRSPDESGIMPLGAIGAAAAVVAAAVFAFVRLRRRGDGAEPPQSSDP